MREYTPTLIAEVTGVSLASISPSIGELEPLEPNIRKNIYNFYGRTVYADLRAVGASAVEARRYRSASVTTVLNRLGQRTELIDDLANLRLPQYREYLIKQGKYISDEDTLATLKESIARNMGRSKLPPSHYDYDSYPTLSHGILDDNF